MSAPPTADSFPKGSQTSGGIRATLSKIYVYYDGPQVLTLRDTSNKPWICVAIDDETYGQYPLFCVRITERDLERYLTERVDLRYLFRFRGGRGGRVADLKQQPDGMLRLTSATVEPDWLPDEGFFARSHTEHGTELDDISSGRKTISVKIDGNWEFPEFAMFSARMSDCYSFLHGMDAGDKFRHPHHYHQDEPSPFEEFPWRRGGSSLSLYKRLGMMVSRRDALNVERIHYASPGEIELRGRADILSKIEAGISCIDKNYPAAKEQYATLHSFLSKNRLLSADKDSAYATPAIQEIIKLHTETLAELIGISDVSTIHVNAESNWLLTAKIMMSYYRRLDALFQFYAEGRAKSEQAGP